MKLVKGIFAVFLVLSMAFAGLVLVTLNHEQKVQLDLGVFLFEPQSVWVWVLVGVFVGVTLAFAVSVSAFLQEKRLRHLLRKKDEELTKLRTGVLKN